MSGGGKFFRCFLAFERCLTEPSISLFRRRKQAQDAAAAAKKAKKKKKSKKSKADDQDYDSQEDQERLVGQDQGDGDYTDDDGAYDDKKKKSKYDDGY